MSEPSSRNGFLLRVKAHMLGEKELNMTIFLKKWGLISLKAKKQWNICETWNKEHTQLPENSVLFL
ncbi:hypothetical protein [Neobacillus sp. YIM B06451]|uniref:hypothetical protein n=1 Tax=Neobacillus sp. YIM B06451 TaxID=3070994 RepID=UPI00292E7F04|nr:hypothetical protein [Neobacillus sp. YIM B06451]